MCIQRNSLVNGENCSEPSDCASNACIDDPQLRASYCQPERGALGAYCLSNSDCQSGACSDVCIVANSLALGESCNSDDLCASGKHLVLMHRYFGTDTPLFAGFCHAGDCIEPGTVQLGGYCMESEACAEGLRCRISGESGRGCFDDDSPLAPAVRTCASDDECSTGHCGALVYPGTDYFFYSDICSYPALEGMRCYVDGDCRSGQCTLASPTSAFTTCQAALVQPSQRARAKRRLDLMGIRQRFACPAGFEMCLLGAASGYECIDTANSLEHCGGCNNAEDPAQQGEDCSDLAELGTSSVACQHSRCVASESFWLRSRRLLADHGGWRKPSVSSATHSQRPASVYPASIPCSSVAV